VHLFFFFVKKHLKIFFWYGINHFAGKNGEMFIERGSELAGLKRVEVPGHPLTAEALKTTE
jgi:hypothetical protein